jgi:AcrR family transcriptional regulator
LNIAASAANTANSSDKPNRMERRRLETRSKLLKATLKLVIKKGIEKTTLDDITEAADLGRRTFYYHFSGKDECIQAAAASIYKRHGEEVDLTTKSDNAAFIVALAVQRVLAGLIREPITRLLMERPRLLGDAVIDALGVFFHRDILRGIEVGTFTPPISQGKLDSLVKWTLVGVIVEASEEDSKLADDLADYSQTILMILGVPAQQAKSAATKARKALPH